MKFFLAHLYKTYKVTKLHEQGIYNAMHVNDDICDERGKKGRKQCLFLRHREAKHFARKVLKQNKVVSRFGCNVQTHGSFVVAARTSKDRTYEHPAILVILQQTGVL